MLTWRMSRPVGAIAWGCRQSLAQNAAMIHVKASFTPVGQTPRMIHYQLQCGGGHGFDGWFRDSAAFEQQANCGLLECPVCGDTRVERALMAPALPRKGNARRDLPEVEAPSPPAPPPPPAPAPAPEAATPSPAALAGHIPDHVRAMLQRVRAEVEKNCDYVGDGFATEARRIHRGESDRRGIYGEASPAEAEELADEGIDIARIPWVPRADG